MSAQQTRLGDFGPDLSPLTDRERDAYESVRLGDLGAREWARREDVSPGTVANLLHRADARLEGREPER